MPTPTSKRLNLVMGLAALTSARLVFTIPSKGVCPVPNGKDHP